MISVIAGFGPGLGEEIASRLVDRGPVIGLSRTGQTMDHPQFHGLACDLTQEDEVSATFKQIRQDWGSPDVLVHNVGQLVLDDFMNISPETFLAQWQRSCLSAVLVAKQVLPGMLEKGRGTMVFSGATASDKAGPKSSAFASAKFALRGLSQALARQYGPQGIHVAHVILDGVIWGDRARNRFKMAEDQCMDPSHIAQAYVSLIEQPKSAWTHELDLRPFGEPF